jgi:hypothetical protein
MIVASCEHLLQCLASSPARMSKYAVIAVPQVSHTCTKLK